MDFKKWFKNPIPWFGGFVLLSGLSLTNVWQAPVILLAAVGIIGGVVAIFGKHI